MKIQTVFFQLKYDRKMQVNSWKSDSEIYEAAIADAWWKNITLDV